MASVRNIASATGILALSVLAACSRGGSSLTSSDQVKPQEVTASVTAQERKYSFKDGEEVVEAFIPGDKDRGEALVQVKGVDYKISDLCVGSSDKGCDQVALIIQKGSETRQVLLEKNAQGAFADVCIVDGATEGGEATVEGAFGVLIQKDQKSADCKNSPVKKPVVKQVEDAAKKVGENVKDGVEQVKEEVTK